MLALTASGAYTARAQANHRSAIENPAALLKFYDSLIEAKYGTQPRTVRILQYGDSHTAADLFTGHLRRYFQDDFGDATRSESGVIFRIKGVNGMRAKQLINRDERALRLKPEYYNSIADQQPDLVILSFGSNEVTDGDWSVDSYQRLYSAILDSIRGAAPHAAILVIAPPARSVATAQGWQPTKRMLSLIEAQRRAALEAGASLWNACEAMGGTASMNEWVASRLGQSDHVHLTAPGYRELARRFYTDFVVSYNNYINRLNTRQQ